MPNAPPKIHSRHASVYFFMLNPLSALSLVLSLPLNFPPPSPTLIKKEDSYKDGIIVRKEEDEGNERVEGLGNGMMINE